MMYHVAVHMFLVITSNHYHIYAACDLVVVNQPGCAILPVVLFSVTMNTIALITVVESSFSVCHYVLNAIIKPKQ